MSCTDCQKRMHLSLEGNNNTSTAANQNEALIVAAEPQHHVTHDPPIIDFSVPITQTILNHMRKGYMSDYSCHDEVSSLDVIVVMRLTIVMVKSIMVMMAIV